MKLIDAHIHLYDNNVIPHDHLNKKNPVFEELLGDYSSLPKKFLWDDYLKQIDDYEVKGLVWHEFVSDLPRDETIWAQSYLSTLDIEFAMVCAIDFSNEQCRELLDFYQQFSHVSSVRQHMVYHPTNPMKRFTDIPSYFDNTTWQKNIKALAHADLKCNLEVGSNQLDGVYEVVKNNPNIGFTIALMGWPYDTSKECFLHWKKQINKLKALENTCFIASAVECILGINWSCDDLKPWLLTLIETVGIERCMFGSHSPICSLSKSLAQQIACYQQLLPGLSQHEQELFYYGVAKSWFNVKPAS
jgi:predicted TIM-barrel fold metal-dependent hydrolase